jgi:hypothetical protein
MSRNQGNRRHSSGSLYESFNAATKAWEKRRGLEHEAPPCRLRHQISAQADIAEREKRRKEEGK